MRVPLNNIQTILKGIEEVIFELEEGEGQEENEINAILDEAYEYAINILADMALYADTDMTAVIDKLSIKYYDKATHRGELVLAGGEKEENVGLYVEFGTGIKGLANPHPAIASGQVFWAYDQKGRGKKGWWYPVKEGNYKNPITWTDDEGTLRAWTKGMPSRPFMYDTMVWLLDRVGEKYKVGFEFKGETT